MRGRDVPAPLRAEVRLLGDLLGQVIAEADGPEALAQVAALRKACIALRDAPDEEGVEAVARQVDALAPDAALRMAQAFTVWFQLVNLAEHRWRIRSLQERDDGSAPVQDSLADAVATADRSDGRPALAATLADLRVHPVWTAHPTEARRRAVVDALRRIDAQLTRTDAARIGAAEHASIRRHLLEEIDILWRTAQLRSQRPTPLDEVRKLMAVFDHTVFRTVPHFYRELDRALDPEGVGARPPGFGAFLRFGSWVGGDRDGNPRVTAAVTAEAMAVMHDRVLRGLENAADRIARTLTATDDTAPPSAALLASLEDDERRFPEAATALRRRAPEAPHRRKLGLAAARIAATRAAAAGAAPEGAGGVPADSAAARARALAYTADTDLLADIVLVQESLAPHAPRLAFGELQHLRWQVETFGFHLASLEIRQHASVHAAALRALGLDPDDAAALRAAAADPPAVHATPPAPAEEVIATLRTVADLQARYGAQACRRYVVSFTTRLEDLLAVRALAAVAGLDPAAVEVVPLLETRADLEKGPDLLAAWWAELGQPAEMEVMLGYSDSAKDAGFLAANLALHAAQRRLAVWARHSGVQLTQFHGRGGALGRGGGPTNRAVLSQPPGAVAGRLKITEQGEVINQRYANIAMTARHLEQATAATVLASLPSADRRPDGWADHRPVVQTMAAAAEDAYRALVEADGFADFFACVTPSEEIGNLQIGSRPARRRRGGGLESLRAIPWVFAWSQCRVNLPGWYGLGAGLQAAADVHGLPALRVLHERWPFFTSLLENAQMSLAKADALIGRRYLALGRRPELTDQILEELERSRRMVLAVTGHDRLLGGRPVLARSVELRTPYLDVLSLLQARFLARLRAGHGNQRDEEIVMLTMNGIAAALQNTG